MILDYLQALETARRHLVDRRVHFSAGLSADEISNIELRYRIRFPEDLRLFLEMAIPLGDGFLDWRGCDSAIGNFLRWPEEGICFDISNNGFWCRDWGIRPQSDEAALEIARANLRSLPPMIPICGHAYLPSEPPTAGNPVFAIHQADVIHRGRNVAEFLLYFKHDELDEEIEARYPVFGSDYRYINFWTDLARANADGAHTEEDQYKAVTRFDGILSDPFVAIVDDTSRS